jgi:DNA-directed RNA polymerase beta' subunit
MGDKEKVFELIYNTGEIEKKEIKNRTGLTHKRLKEILDELYWNGLVDIRRGVVSAVAEDKIGETFLKRNVDIQYLRSAIDIGKVDALLSRFSHLVEAGIKESPVSTGSKVEEVLANIRRMSNQTEEKFREVEGRMEEVFALYGKLREVIALRKEYERKVSEKLKE